MFGFNPIFTKVSWYIAESNRQRPQQGCSSMSAELALNERLDRLDQAPLGNHLVDGSSQGRRLVASPTAVQATLAMRAL